MGSLAILRTLRTLSSGSSIFSAISSGVGSRRILERVARGADELVIVSIMCTGMRIVLAWSRWRV